MSTPQTDAATQNLASCYQEIFTVAARLRSKKFALPDSAVFRTQVRQALQHAEGAAQALGYAADDVKLSSFAVVALLDETILTSNNPAFREWSGKPLMLDLFGATTAGETLFDYMRAAMGRPESKSATDLLEIYFLCLALGFRGRYSSAAPEQLRAAWRDPLANRILRARGGADPVVLSRSWPPEAEVDVPPPSARWTRVALICFVSAAAGCIVMAVAYSLLLGKGVAALTSLVQK